MNDDDIVNAIYRLRRAFQKHRVEPPDVMEWSDPEKGARAADVISRTLRERNDFLAMDADAVLYRECKILGITLRWKARRMALSDGGDYLY